MTALSTTAQRIRRHRLAFELALQLGCTPREAREEIRRRAAAQRRRDALARLATRIGKQPESFNTGLSGTDGAEKPEFWWKRDDL